MLHTTVFWWWNVIKNIRKMHAKFLFVPYPDWGTGWNELGLWPPQLPNLTPPDINLWGHMIDRVNKKKCNLWDELWYYIQGATFLNIMTPLCWNLIHKCASASVDFLTNSILTNKNWWNYMYTGTFWLPFKSKTQFVKHINKNYSVYIKFNVSEIN